MLMQNLSIRTKVIGAFGLMLLMTCFLGFFSTRQLSAVNDGANDIRSNWLPSVSALGQVAMLTDRIRAIQSAVIDTPAGADTSKVDDAMRIALDGRQQAWNAYLPLVSSPEEKAL